MHSAIRSVVVIGICLGGLSACSDKEIAPVEYYNVSFRKHPPEPVYSRVIWSHLPHPVKPKVADTAPLMLPVVDFEMPQGTLGEAIEALAQAMGYRWHYPASVSGRKIRVRMSGTVEDVLAEISKQAGVRGEFDHEQRMVKILDEQMIPRLPRG